MVMNTRERGSLGPAAGPVETNTSPTSASTAFPSASAASPASAAAPGVLGTVAETLELLGVVGGGPCLDGILGGVGLNHRPHILARLLRGEDVDVRRQWRLWAIEDAAPRPVDAHQSRRWVAEELRQPLYALVDSSCDVPHVGLHGFPLCLGCFPCLGCCPGCPWHRVGGA